jgi:hypothetical protein
VTHLYSAPSGPCESLESRQGTSSVSVSNDISHPFPSVSLTSMFDATPARGDSVRGRAEGDGDRGRSVLSKGERHAIIVQGFDKVL